MKPSDIVAPPIPDWLAQYVIEQRDATREQDPRLHRWLEEQSALHLYSEIGGEVLLRSDGSVWLHPEDGEPHEAKGIDRWICLVIAIRRYPALRELLPARPATAQTHRPCSGTGFITVDMRTGKLLEKTTIGDDPRTQFVCGECGGLGWVA